MSDESTNPYEGELPADPDLAPAEDDTKDDDLGDDIAAALPGDESVARAESGGPLP
jgi:hypothetical protein